MTDNPASKMVRVSTPLIPQVQKLCELHRQGHTEALLRGLDEIISAIEAGSAITLTPTDSALLADVLVRVERLESQALTQDAKVPTVTIEYAEPQTLEYPLSQRQLSLRLGQPYSYYLQKHRQKGKAHFEVWSQSVDPDGIAWTFDEPKRRRGKVPGKPLNFYPKL